MRRDKSRFAAALVVLLALGVGLPGCGDGGDGSTTVVTIIREQPATETATTEARPQPSEVKPAPPAKRRLDVTSPISTEGLGPVLVGMTEAEAERAANIDLTFPSGQDEGCRYAEVRGLKDVGLMFNHDQIARVDINNPSIETLSGISIGSSEAEVSAAYGERIQIETHFYDKEGHYMSYVPADQSDPTRVVFETDGQTITSIRAGRLPEVNFVEGCS